ncbi:MAG: hypothetical protein IM569_13740 [Chitinophagaceae bacterium]|nr:hypothetical protein [Chitinophagaceae bacterium]
MAQQTAVGTPIYLEDMIINTRWKYKLMVIEIKDKTYQERGKFGRAFNNFASNRKKIKNQKKQ